jgi:hypothetical protein
MPRNDGSPWNAIGPVAALVAAGIVKWARAHRPSAARIARGAVAGAAAAGIVVAGRALLDAAREEEPEGDRSDLPARLLAGAGRGVLYAAILDPLLPGHPLVKGAIVGSAEHLAAPLGGLYSALEPVSPLRNVPFVAALLQVGADEDPYLAHLANGLLLGLLVGPSREVSHERGEES